MGGLPAGGCTDGRLAGNRKLETGNFPAYCLPWFGCELQALWAGSACFTFASMARESSTLRLGDRAPDFTLAAANRPGTVSLAERLARGPVIVEFLRGTW